MRGWQGYPSEKSWFSIHFPWVNHILYCPGAPECPAVVGHSFYFATPDLSKRKNQLAGTLGMVESIIHCWMSAQPEEQEFAILTRIYWLFHFCPTGTLSCVSLTDLGISAWCEWEQGLKWFGMVWSRAEMPEWCKQRPGVLSDALRLLCSIAAPSTELSCVYFQLFGGYQQCKMRCSFSLFQTSLPLKLIFLLL